MRGWPIAKPGRRARHIIFYRVNQSGDLEIVLVWSFAMVLAESTDACCPLIDEDLQ